MLEGGPRFEGEPTLEGEPRLEGELMLEGRAGGNMIAKYSFLMMVLFAAAEPAIAQQSRSNPYNNLFKPRDLKETARLQQAPRPEQSSARCDITKVPVNPQTDPKVARDPAITHYALRVLPPACR
jgi:hypothetical protein